MAEKIRDLLYFDFEKTASLFSQLEDGLLREVKSTSESSETTNKSFKGNISVVAGEVAGGSQDKKQVIESRSLHHNLLTKVEQGLIGRKVVSELNLLEAPSCEQLREESQKCPYLLAEGRVSIEDFIRLNDFSEVFNKFGEIISWSSLFGNQSYQAKKNELANLPRGKNQKNKRDRKKLEKEIEQIEQAARTEIGLDQLDEKLFENIRFMIDHFLKEVITMRFVPFDSLPNFQVIANLKKDSFVDDNIDSLIRAYGRRPNVKLTIFGLVTSIPEKEEDIFWRNLADQEAKNPNSDSPTIENAFFSMSNALENIDKMLRFTRYPNVTVYPLAIYRSISLGRASET